MALSPWTTVISFWVICVVCSLSVAKILFYFSSSSDSDLSEVDDWIKENDLKSYSNIFKAKGKLSMVYII